MCRLHWKCVYVCVCVYFVHSQLHSTKFTFRCFGDVVDFSCIKIKLKCWWCCCMVYLLIGFYVSQTKTVRVCETVGVCNDWVHLARAQMCKCTLASSLDWWKLLLSKWSKSAAQLDRIRCIAGRSLKRSTSTLIYMITTYMCIYVWQIGKLSCTHSWPLPKPNAFIYRMENWCFSCKHPFNV